MLSKLLTLTFYLGQRQSDCKVNVCVSDAFTVQHTGDTHKSEKLVVVRLPLVRQILLVTLTDNIVAAVIVQRVLGEGRGSIQLGDDCGCDRVGSLDVSVTVVNAHNQ